MKDPKQMTDKELYRKCQEAGQNARKWMKVFSGLLPEVEKRQLYKKHGFHTIFEFAAKLAGMRRETVAEILRVGKKLEELPKLKETFEKGDQGWSKIRSVASIATPKTDDLWAKRVKTLSKSAVEELAKQIRNEQLQEVDQESLPGEGFSGGKNNIKEKVPFHSVNMQLSPQIHARLIELKAQIEKKRKVPITYDELMNILLNAFDPKIENLPQYQEIIHKCPECQKSTLKSSCGDIELDEKNLKNREKIGETVNLEEKKETKTKKSSRYIPAKVKKIIQLEHGKGCSYPGCKKPAKVLHHTKRFVLDSRNEPELLKPLCKTHHELCHGSAVVGEEASPVQWSLSLEPCGTESKRRIDEKFLMHKGNGA